MDAHAPFHALVRATLDLADRAVAEALNARNYARVAQLATALERRDDVLAAAAALDGQLAPLRELLGSPACPQVPEQAAQRPAVAPSQWDSDPCANPVAYHAPMSKLRRVDTGVQRRHEDWKLSIHWNEGEPATSTLIRRKGSRALTALVELLLERQGDDGLRRLRTVRCNRGPLISQRPEVDFTTGAGRPYGHQRVGSSPWYVLTHSASDEKVALMQQLGRICGFSIKIERGDVEPGAESHSDDVEPGVDAGSDDSDWDDLQI